MRILDIDQESEEWVAWRESGLGSSDAAAIMGVSPYKSRAQLFKSKAYPLVGKEREDNEAMRRGRRLEPKARGYYEQVTGIKTRRVCVLHDDLDWLKASLDGLSEDDRIVLEIKCIKKDYHALALAGRIPPLYYPQLQHQLIATGLDVLHYWSYSESSTFPGRQRLALVIVSADHAYQQRLLDEEKRFWKEVMGERIKISRSLARHLS